MNQINPSSFETKALDANQQLIKILIVDDQKVVRAKLQEIISSTDNLSLVGMTDDGEQAISFIKGLQPDVVLMDIEMPKMNGIKITEIISQRFPASKILILSTHEEEEYAQQSLSAGASGYVLKHTSPTNLIAAIYTVYRGYSHFGLETLKQIQLNLTNTEVSKNNAHLQPKLSPQQVNSQDRGQIVDQSRIVPKINNNSVNSLPTVNAEEFLPSISKWLTWGSATVFTVIMLAIPTTSLLKYKTTVKAPANVRPVGETHLIQAATEGKIIAIPVKSGQLVKPGDLIAQVDSSRLQTRKNQLQKAIAQQNLKLARLDAQIRIIANQIVVEKERISSEVLAAQAELAGNQRQYQETKVAVDTGVREAKAQIQATEARLKAAQSRTTRYQLAANQGALSQERLEEAKLEVEQQQQEMKTAQALLERALSVLDPDLSEVEIAQQRIYQAEKSGQAVIANLNREQEAIQQQQIEIKQQLEQEAEELSQVDVDLENTKIITTVRGTISQLQIRNPGQTVQLGQEIAQIVPRNAALEIKVLVSTQDINKLKPAQKVQMRISACPYPDYGTLKGRVSRIPKDTTKPPTNSSIGDSPSTQFTAAFYEVTVTPDQNDFGRGEDQCSLYLGMEGTASIITREETVMKFLLRKARLTSNL